MKSTKFLNLLIAVVLGLTTLASIAVTSISASNGNNNNGNKITICHATSSNSNPYVINTPDANGNVDGHDDHDGPIWPATNTHGDWGDIIPPFSYNDHGQQSQYLGKNWTTVGQSIWNNGCNIPTSSPAPSPSASVVIVSPSPSASIAVSPSPSVSANPSSSVTPSSSPSASASATASPSVSATPTPSASSNNSSDNSDDNANGTSDNNNPQGSTGEVLGTSTLAATGNSENLMAILMTFGLLLMVGSTIKYAKEQTA